MRVKPCALNHALSLKPIFAANKTKGCTNSRQKTDMLRRNEKDTKKNSMEDLHRAIEESKYTVAVTGAGICLSAGGCTFAAMQSRYGFGSWDMRSDVPSRVYQVYSRAFLQSMFEHGPTPTHRALARLEADGKLQGIITTNVDCLHTMAGSKEVAEIQGSFAVSVCPECKQRYYGYEIWNQGSMPKCEKCKKMLQPFPVYSHEGLMEPDVVKAQEWIEQAELILVMGTNGTYLHTYWDFRNKEAKVIQINPKRTSFSRKADWNIREEADTVFGEFL